MKRAGLISRRERSDKTKQFDIYETYVYHSLCSIIYTRGEMGVEVIREVKNFHYDFWVANLLYF